MAAQTLFRVMVRCPLTHQPAFTGLVLDQQAFAQLAPQFFLCSACGWEHRWKFGEASLAPQPEPRATPQDPPNRDPQPVDVPPVLPERRTARTA